MSCYLTATKVGTNPITGHPTPIKAHTTRMHTSRSSFDRHNYKLCLPLDAHPNQMVCFVLWQTNGFFFCCGKVVSVYFWVLWYFPSFCFYSPHNKSITFLLFWRRHRLSMSLRCFFFEPRAFAPSQLPLSLRMTGTTCAKAGLCGLSRMRFSCCLLGALP